MLGRDRLRWRKTGSDGFRETGFVSERKRKRARETGMDGERDMLCWRD